MKRRTEKRKSRFADRSAKLLGFSVRMRKNYVNGLRNERPDTVNIRKIPDAILSSVTKKIFMKKSRKNLVGELEVKNRLLLD